MTAKAPYHPKSRFKSQLENDYFNYLYALKQAGEIKAFTYEAFSVRLAWGTSTRSKKYTPDFLVINAEGEVEFHETKGSKNARGQKMALDRLDRAQAKYDYFRWVLVEKNDQGGWKKTEVK